MATWMRSWRAAALVTAVLVAACSTEKASPAAGLELIVAADGLSAPSDFNDIRLEISEEDPGGGWKQLWNRDYVVPSQEATLPATFGIGVGSSPNEEALVTVTAFKNGPTGQAAIVQRVAEVQLPSDRVAALWLVLAQDCKGQVTSIGAEGEAASTCPAGESCQPGNGQCGSNVIADPAALPTYIPGATLDAGLALGLVLGDGGVALPLVAPEGGTDAGDGATTESPDAESDADATTTAMMDGDDTADSTTPVGAVDGTTPLVEAGGSGGCTNACTHDQATCAAGGGIQDCAMGTNGCWAYAAAVPCATSHETCTGSPGSAACTCAVDPVCTSTQSACSGQLAVATCTTDAAGCFYVSGTSTCANGQTCQSGACACPASAPTTCGGVFVNTSSSAANCGSCNHSCLGGLCSAGVCQPVTVATGRTSPGSIAVNASGVYWIETSGVFGVPLSGGAVQTLASSAYLNAPYGIAADASGVYYTNQGGNTANGSVMTLAPFSGTPPVVFAPSSKGAAPTGIVIASKTVYWCDRYWNSVFDAPESTSAQEYVYDGSEINPTAPYTLAADATNVYFMGDGAMAGNGTGIFQCPLPGCSSQTAALIYSPAAGTVATAGGYLVFDSTTSSSMPAIMETRVGSGYVTTVASGASLTGALAADSSGIYWDDGSVEQMPLGGGNVTTVASGQSATSIALDATAIYWTNQSAGTVTKVAK